MRLKVITNIAIAIGSIATQGFAQSGRILTHTENGLQHSEWVPQDYEEVWWPETPWKEFREDTLASFKAMGVKVNSFSVLVRRKDMEAYLRGGESPMNGHYIHINWYPQAQMPTSVQTSEMMKKMGGGSDKFIKPLKNVDGMKEFIQKYVSVGSMVPLGVFREWNGGYVVGLAIGLEMVKDGKRWKSAKIQSMAFQRCRDGYYIVNYTTLQEYGPKLNEHLDRAMAIAKAMTNSPSTR